MNRRDLSIESKKAMVEYYCATTDCNDCILDIAEVFSTKSPTERNCLHIAKAPESDLDAALRLMETDRFMDYMAATVTLYRRVAIDDFRPDCDSLFDSLFEHLKITHWRRMPEAPPCE